LATRLGAGYFPKAQTANSRCCRLAMSLRFDCSRQNYRIGRLLPLTLFSFWPLLVVQFGGSRTRTPKLAPVLGLVQEARRLTLARSHIAPCDVAMLA